MSPCIIPVSNIQQIQGVG